MTEPDFYAAILYRLEWIWLGLCVLIGINALHFVFAGWRARWRRF